MPCGMQKYLCNNLSADIFGNSHCPATCLLEMRNSPRAITSLCRNLSLCYLPYLVILLSRWGTALNFRDVCPLAGDSTE
jgi:hypothetical protein